MLGALIGAGSSLIGGLLTRDAQSKANDAALADKERDRELQKQFAQNGIQWKVSDARAAGIHPLYALGANTVSYSPSSVGLVPETGLGTGMAAAGQDLSRAINATRSAGAREDAYTKTMQDLTLQKAGLENEYLASQIAKLRASLNPPMPTLSTVPVPEASGPEKRPVLMMGGERWPTNSNTSNADEFEKRYGEVTDWTFGPYVLWQDLMAKSRGAAAANIDKWPSSSFWSPHMRRLKSYIERR